MAYSDRVLAKRDAADLLKLMGDPIRLAVLEALREEPQNVGAMVDLLQVNQQTLSHHLAVMRLVGLVASERHGRFSFYRITPLGACAIMCADSIVAD